MDDTNQIIEERRAKLKALRSAGIAFPNDFVRVRHTGDLVAQHAAAEREALEIEAATVAGRILLKRVMGKTSFATLQDTSGRIPLYVSEGDTGKDALDAFTHYDIGDDVLNEKAKNIARLQSTRRDFISADAARVRSLYANG